MGTVYLVGAGPGDPGLITVRGRDLLRRAGAVVYDALVNPALLREAPQAEAIDAGKKTGEHPLEQADINRLLVGLAQRHGIVVRLKGGDPFVFGRGGEEALALAAAGVPFEIVPGVTAGIAAPAFAGIPITHRGVASSVTFLTGRPGPLGASSTLPDLARLAVEGTLCIYMGVRALPAIVAALRAAGRRADTPAAAIEWGTFARQRTVAGTLSDIADRCAAAAIAAPALLVVGEVVRLRGELAWFESRPLHGLRVAVTHAVQRQGALEQRLRDLGATVIEFPTIEFAPPAAPPEAAASAPDPAAFDWIVLTSVNAAEALFERIDAARRDARCLAQVRFCAIGASAVEALARRCLHADAAPAGYTPEAALDAMTAVGPVAGARVLIPRGDLARAALADALRAARATVTEWAAYAPRIPACAAAAAAQLVAAPPDVVVFTNSRAAANFARLAGAEGCARLAGATAFASIGPVTTAAARAAGIAISIEPARHDVPSLLEALCAWRSARGS